MSKNFLRIVALAVFLACNVSAVPISSIFLDKIAPKTEDPTPFLINGNVANSSTIAPYIVSLSTSKLVYAHACSGSIIAKEWVLTAAHCLQDIEKKNGGTNGNGTLGYPVYAGLNDRSNLEGAQIRHIDFAFVHKHFKGVVGSEDIALLHLDKPFDFNENVRSIALPSLREDFEGEEATSYGWGLVQDAAPTYSKELRVARAKVVHEKKCRGEMPPKAPLNPRTICARVQACLGDGGSPLVIERNGYTMELIGLTSWGIIPCGFDNRPTAFMAISHYVDWIAEVQWAHAILHGRK